MARYKIKQAAGLAACFFYAHSRWLFFSAGTRPAFDPSSGAGTCSATPAALPLGAAPTGTPTHRVGRELLFQVAAAAIRALRVLGAVHQGFEGPLALLTDVFVDWHIA